MVSDFITEKLDQLTAQHVIPFWAIIVILLVLATLAFMATKKILKKYKEHRLVVRLHGIYIGFYALSETSSLPVGAAFSVLSLATLAMIVSPGGLGAFPVAVQQVLLIYGLNNISFGWLMWGVTTGIVIVVGMLCFGLLIYQNKNIKNSLKNEV
jgi:hypothetical protein